MKRILLICLAVLWLVPGVAMAHSKLEKAVPAQDATLAVSPERIELTFNTKIEKLSQFKIMNAAGEEIEHDKIEVDGRAMSGNVPAALPNGSYTVKWTIIGADGHSVEGDYAFTVEAPIVIDEPSSEPEATEAPAETTSPAPAPKASMNATETVTNNETTTAHTGTTYAPAIIIGSIIVAAALVLFLRRRK